jgi:hypothetical protein
LFVLVLSSFQMSQLDLLNLLVEQFKLFSGGSRSEVDRDSRNTADNENNNDDDESDDSNDNDDDESNDDDGEAWEDMEGDGAWMSTSSSSSSDDRGRMPRRTARLRTPRLAGKKRAVDRGNGKRSNTGLEYILRSA